MSPASFLLHTPWQMNVTLRRRMHAAEDKLWGLPQAGRRLERYVEDLIELIELILFHPAPRSSTYRTNGSDCLPNSKRPLILRSSASHGSRHPWLIQARRSWRNPGRRLQWSQGRRPQLPQARRHSPVQTQALRRSQGKQAHQPPGKSRPPSMCPWEYWCHMRVWVGAQLQSPLLTSALLSPLLVSALQCPLLTSQLQCPLLASPLQCALLASPLQCALLASPLLTSPLQCPCLQCPLLPPGPVPPEHPHVPAPHKLPPDFIDFPKKIVLGSHMSMALVAGPKAKETPEPPWPLEPSASPLEAYHVFILD